MAEDVETGQALPAVRREWTRWHWVIFTLILAAFLIPVKLTMEASLWEHVMDFAHVPAFAGIALYVALRRAPEKRDLAALLGVFILVTAFGGAVEVLQYLTGRQASAGDFLNSTAGVFLGVVGMAIWARGLAWRLVYVGYAALVCAATALPAWRLWGAVCSRELNFPVIADFESMQEFRLWYVTIAHDNPYGSSVDPATVGVAHGRQSARVAIRVRDGLPYPGTRLHLGDKDWSAYSSLAFDIYNPGEPFTLSVRLDDDFPPKRVDDRFNRALELSRGWNHIRIPFSELVKRVRGRALNLKCMRRLIFFLDDPKESRLFYLDWIRLE